MARDQGHDNLAFVLLNRYIDLTEAIEEGNTDNIDNADFADATNVPFPFDLPTQQYLPHEDDREEIRDWVLTICMDKSVDQQLPAKQQALGTAYSGLYASDLPTCIVTGYPVQKWELLNVNKSVANKVHHECTQIEIKFACLRRIGTSMYGKSRSVHGQTRTRGHSTERGDEELRTCDTIPRSRGTTMKLKSCHRAICPVRNKSEQTAVNAPTIKWIPYRNRPRRRETVLS